MNSGSYPKKTATDTQVYRIDGMHCGSCVARIEQGLKRAFPEVSDVRVNLVTNQAVIEGDPPPEQVLKTVADLGYEGVLLNDGRTLARRNGLTPAKELDVPKSETGQASEQKAKWRLGVALVLTVPLFVIHMANWHFTGSGWVQLALATPVLFYAGQDIFKTAFRLLKRRDTNMDTLIALGSGVAWLASVFSLLLASVGLSAWVEGLYFETAAMIVTLILLGRYLEARARQRAGSAIESLMRLRPETALVLRDGHYRETPTSQVRVDDAVMVRPGGLIPLDGVVMEGSASVSEAMLTGESMPVAKQPGDAVLGGTLAEGGSLIIRVTQVGAETVLARLIALVEKAQSGKPPIQRLADRVAGVFVPVVLGLALLTVLGWLLTGGSLQMALSAAIAVLVIACPCALGLATPTAIQVGLGRAASEGILIQDTAGLERVHKLTVLVMDKTGTLTLGEPQVTHFEVLPSALAESSVNHQEGVKSVESVQLEVLRVVAALEARSEHPLARAIVAYAQAQGVEVSSATVQSFRSETAGGVLGEAEGQHVMIGQAAFLQRQGVNVDSWPYQLKKFAEQGQTPVLFALDGQVAGYFLIADPLKSNAEDAVRQLKALGIRPIMMSGDRRETALAIGKQAGFAEADIQGGLSPSQKLEAIKALQSGEKGAARQVVGMVGDGINDAPALAQADVSMAIGTGTDIAMQTAQMTLVHGDIGKAVSAIQLSRAILRTIRQNLFWAFFYNVVAIPLAALGYLSPMIAAAAMALSSVTVVLNSLRLRRA